MVLPSAKSCSRATVLGAGKIADHETNIRRALGQTAHEVGEPVIAVRDVDADAVAIPDQPALKIHPNIGHPSYSGLRPFALWICRRRNTCASPKCRPGRKWRDSPCA